LHPVDFSDLSDVGIRLQIQSVLESIPIHYRFMKTLKGVLLTLQKDKLQCKRFCRALRPPIDLVSGL